MKEFKLWLAVFFVAFSTASLFAANSDPKPISSALPFYPELARTSRVEGTVKLWLTLDASGRVTQTGVISGNPLLRVAAMKTVKSWRFEPGVLSPNARLETEFAFSLGVQPRKGEPSLTVSMKGFRRIEVISELYVEPVE